MSKAFSILFLIFFFGSSAILFVIAFLIKVTTFWWDKNLRVLHSFTQFWGALYIRINPGWKVRVNNPKNIYQDGPCVYICNHQSYFDILVISCLNFPFKWVSKAEVFKVPFIGWNMALNNYIPIKRGDKSSIKQMIQACGRSIDQGNSIIIFPEGTRSEDGGLQRFKSGAFSIALNKKIPIVPIVINGTGNILSKTSNSLNFNASITVTVLKRIDPETYGERSAANLADEVHKLIGAELESAIADNVS